MRGSYPGQQGLPGPADSGGFAPVGEPGGSGGSGAHAAQGHYERGYGQQRYQPDATQSAPDQGYGYAEQGYRDRRYAGPAEGYQEEYPVGQHASHQAAYEHSGYAHARL